MYEGLEALLVHLSSDDKFTVTCYNPLVHRTMLEV